MRRLFFIVICGLSGFCLWSNLYLSSHVPLNTYIGALNVSRQSRLDLIKILYAQLEKPVTIQIKNRHYTYTLKALGVDVDQQKTLSDIFTDQNKVIGYWQSLFSQRMITPRLVFGPKYDSFIENTVYDFSLSKDEINLDQNNKQLLWSSNEEKYKIVKQSLKKQLVYHFGDNKIITPEIVKQTKIKPKELATYNQKLEFIFSQPVKIEVTAYNKQVAFNLLPAVLKQLITLKYNGEPVFSINQTELNKLLLEKTRSLTQQYQDFKLDNQEIYNLLTNLIWARYNGYNQDVIYSALKQKPNTNGDIADKYIEIDISQQMMYLWENKENIASYVISSGLYYPTPPGHYQILNKALNAYSDIYHVYMPYWMAFSLDPKINAYLGIHELPYWIDGSGQQIRRPRNFLGSPHTGGCISLDVGIAEKVYAWAEVEMKVEIYE